MKLKAVLPLGCLGMAMILAILIGLAWVTGNNMSSRFRPILREVSEEDLAAAAAGKLDLNELYFHFDSMAPMSSHTLTAKEREAIVREVLGKAAEVLRKSRDR